METGVPLCNITLSICLLHFFTDQEHLDKEIERLRSQLKVKVNRLFEAQGIGLVGLEVGEEKSLERMLESGCAKPLRWAVGNEQPLSVAAQRTSRLVKPILVTAPFPGTESYLG